MLRTFICLLTLAFSTAAGAAPVTAKIFRQGPTTSFQLGGADHWEYRVQKTEIGGKPVIELDAPAIESAKLAEIVKWNQGLLTKVEVVPGAPSGRSLVRFFLAAANVEYFDYQTDQPSRLILDFYTEEAKKKAADNDEPKEAGKPKAKTAKGGKNAKDRKPASDLLKLGKYDALKVESENIAKETELKNGPLPPGGESQSGVYDGADPSFSRFTIQDYEIKEEAIISAKQNLYMEFPMLRLDLTALQTLISKQPLYEIAAKEGADVDPKKVEENKQARLLLTLFNNKRYNVLLKSANWFRDKFPESEYQEMIDAMVADSQFAIWRETKATGDFDDSILKYRQFIEKYPKSALVPHYQLIMGFATLDRGDYLNAIRNFQLFLRDQKDSAHTDLVQLAIAEAHLKINQFDQAIDMYKKVMREGKSLIDRQRAAYFVGDGYFKKKDYKQAIQAYQTAIQQYPEAISEFPNSYYNQASASFQLEQYRESLDQYRQFLVRFPENNYAGYAMTRVGELLEILGADESRVVGAYLETTFRYGDAPSAVVAKLRLLSSRFKGMKPKEVDKSAEEILTLAKSSHLPKIEQFATLMVADGYTKRGEFDRTIDLLVKYYQEHPTTADTKLLSSRIAKNINDKIRQQVVGGNFMEALSTFDKFSQSWLKSSSRIDTKYLIGRAYEQAGAQGEAEKLYRMTINKIYAMADTQAGRETNVFEKLPSPDELNLRLAATTFHQRKWGEAHDFLINVKNPDKLPEKQQIERVQIAAALLEKRGDLTSAVRYLTDVLKVFKGVPSMLAAPYLDLGDMETRMGKKDDAIKSYRRVDELMDDSADVDPTVHALALEKAGNLQLESGKTADAIASFNELLEKYDTKRQINSIRYKLGKIHFDKGDLKKANEVWQALPADGPSVFWSQMAQENLKNSKWKDDYQKYMGRIPAMAKPEGSRQ